VLARLDKLLAPLSWVAAAAVVVMLLVGPQVVAEDKDKPPASEAAGAAAYATGGKADGKSVFTGNCGSCHTLEAAGTSGQVGPTLDGVSLGAGEIETVVRGGRGGMPSFQGKLSPAEIKAVAAYVAESR